MPTTQWSRSRFWLSYFLQHRHARRRIDWSGMFAQVALDAPDRGWLAHVSRGGGLDRDWLIAQALAQHNHDPAFVQALRLWCKENQFVAHVAERLLPALPAPAADRHGGAATIAARLLRRPLGLRFELARLLLAHLVELGLAQRLAARTPTGPRRDALVQIVDDRREHVAFISEWLTAQFADFNFLRRNLRRLRLRALFAVALAAALLRHRRLVRSIGGAAAVALEQWRCFNRLLERMVPYHRDALLARLLEQMDRPYDAPARLL